MKKFTNLLFLFVLLWGGVKCAFAQSVDSKWVDKYISTMSEALTSTDQINDGFYVFRNVGRQTFLRGYQNNMDDDQLYLKKVSSSTDYATFKNEFIGIDHKAQLDCVAYVTKNANGSFKVQFNTGKYLPQEFFATWSATGPTGKNPPKAASVDLAGDITLGVISGSSFWMKANTGCYADGNGADANSTFVGYEVNVPTNANGNCAYQIYPVELKDVSSYVACTFTAKDAAGNVLASKEAEFGEGTQAANPFTDADVSYFYSDPEFEETDLIVSSSNKTFNVVYKTTDQQPFEFSTMENPKWYRVYFSNNKNQNLAFYGNSENKVDAQKAFTAESFAGVSGQDSYTTFNGALWAFVRGENGGVCLLNKQTGKYVGLQANSAYSGYNQDMAVLSETPALFSVLSNNTANAFSLCVQGTKSACLGNHVGGMCGVWHKDGTETWNDGASKWYIIPADNDEVLSVGKAIKTTMLDDLLSHSAEENYVVAYTADEINAEKTKLESVSTLAALDEVNVNWTAPQFDANAYYLVRNVNWTDAENAYISTEGMKVNKNGVLDDNLGDGNRNIRRTTGSGSLVSRLWQFSDKGNGSFLVRNANTRCCLSAYKNSGMTMDMPTKDEYAGEMTFTTTKTAFADCHSEKTNDKVSMFQMLHNNLRVGARDADGTVLGGEVSDNDADASNYWQFIKVTSIPVSITSVGWTSIAYPFEVTIPSDSKVKAYYAENVENGEIVLAEVSGGVIPANQGVLLYSADGETTVDLKITSSGATLPANKFSPSVAMRAGFSALDTYLFAKNSNGEASFLQSKLTYVPANKAYLETGNIVATTNVLGFRFGGETTGIADANVNEESAERYFDLNGRPVLYPVHGIYVTSKGKKVFVK